MSQQGHRRESFSMFNLDKFPDLPPHYRISTLLGEGAFSLVYRGMDCRKGNDVAIKIINKTNLSKKQIANINNEIYVMNTLNNAGNHPNILRLIESFESEQSSYLILEYCDGGEIFDKIIEHTYLSEDLARHVFLQLLDAVSFMNENHIVHRDIKPENLLFESIPKIDRPDTEFRKALRSSDDESKVDEGIFQPGIGGGGIGTIKLADFGLAKQLKYDSSSNLGQARSNLKTPCGTAGYTAPEVIHCGVERKRRFRSAHSRSNFYSKSVDIWSLGCFLYTLLCGFPPFYDDDNEVLTQKILHGEFVFLAPWWDEISSDAKDLISKMLVVNAKSRITLEGIYKHPWMKNSVSLKQSSYFPEQNISKYTGESVPQEKTKHIKSPAGMVGGLISPKIAIKQVFDNPAMSYVSLHLLAQSKKEKPKVSPEFKEVKFDSRARRDSKSISSLPKSPNPMNRVNFSDVFKTDALMSALNDDNTDLDSEDAFDGSNGDSLNEFADSQSASSDEESIREPMDIETFEFDENGPLSRFHVREEILEHVDLKNLSLSSTTSVDSLKLSDDAYATRSSSVISGANGEFEFTLNLNDLSLLRRRSSTKRN
ncbi:Pkinase-domain-containing protein [Metschnikowia bicuspidata var. bicuspidata NRRL YB-4993]|uniref:Pkinase-domain-containing protein n=1 Tax=Metschnikowia bicuspidata var. bicuspidata NRRL YB-4993 TaxID=869754 RepID=A0A1A0HBG4_9ASCO|nr:Pkinase-domain-containing protein [Metschnikowia bicuspidata var. bicuspidata NRRL YB-4993]OBA21217.1 Pkinase-domain-containing protein [Metschnikowia bicuspidata var. bicuspidata NRRL YB-4993]